MSNKKFYLLELFKFEENEPLASWNELAMAIEICESPRQGEKFVIAEQHYSFANDCYFECNYYRSERTLRTAFEAGLLRYLKAKAAKPPRKPRTVKEYLTQVLRMRKSPYAGRRGHLKTRCYKNFETPWFLAKKGDEIKGDLAITKKKTRRRPKR